ncbi:MAG TPA: ATP-binding protein [Puia sp.]|nr:ATP-binding protein [Puia sp.]
MYKRKRLAIATLVYWLQLVYIIAGLVFWYIELQKQNLQMTDYKLQELKKDDPGFESKVNSISLEKKNKTAQYIGEGITFLSVISVGAIFLYRAVMRQIKIQHQQQNFMMAVTHELKTPIAIARLNLETLQKYNLDENRQEKVIQSALQEIDRLNALANNVLVSAQLEGGYYQLAKDEIDFSALVKSTVDEFNRRFPEKEWEISIQPSITVIGDALLLQIMVNNLVENAVKYSPKQGKISVSLNKENAQTFLQVKDEGPGIPAAEWKKIFKRFYRIGNEETRTTQGTGLGLYLCKKIVADHGAKISISDNSPAGTIFKVVF